MSQTPTIAIGGLTSHLNNLIADLNYDAARGYYSYPFRYEVKNHAEKEHGANTAVQNNLLSTIQTLDKEFAEDPLNAETIKTILNTIEKSW